MFIVPVPALPRPEPEDEGVVPELFERPGRYTVYAYADNPMVASRTSTPIVTTLFISRACPTGVSS